ncbi:MAG: hypothetical protein GQ582_12825 [Methyloprofundus sp.]|nr:hypothetical protein [Methyloprofundus sp.]
MIIKQERSPRVAKALNIDIKNIKNEYLHTQTVNVSIGGFAIQCSMQERNQLTPEGDFVVQGKPVEVDVNIQLPSPKKGKVEAMKAKCRIIYSRRISQDKCQLGLCFIELFGDGQDKLYTLVNKALDRGEACPPESVA